MVPFCGTELRPQMEINGFMTPYCSESAAETTDTARLLHFSSAFPAGEQHNSYMTGWCSVPECTKAPRCYSGPCLQEPSKNWEKAGYGRIKSKWIHAKLNSINEL